MDALNILQMAHEGDTPAASEPPTIQASRDSSARKLAVMPKPKNEPAKKETRRTRGQGSLYVRNQTYWMELHYGGERIRQSLNIAATGKDADRNAALDKLADEVARIRRGEQPKKFEPVSVQSMFDAWMTEVERTCKPRTIADYRSRWTAHLEPTFGKLFATQVSKDRVVEYLNRRMKEGAGPITQNRENRVLQMIFEYNRSKIAANSYPEFPKFHSEKNHVRKGRMSKEDYETLQTRLNDPKLFWLKVFLTMTFKYGFRKGELLNAKVSYFNAKESTFTLPAFTTKNKQERIVDLVPNGEIYNMLVKLTEGRKPEDALFTRNGKPVRDFRGEWAKQTQGVKGGSGKGGAVTIHDLRRSALTGMAEKGISAEQAGTHLTPDVFRRYISRSKAERQQTAAKIEG
jgi:integrase